VSPARAERLPFSFDDAATTTPDASSTTTTATPSRPGIGPIGYVQSFNFIVAMLVVVFALEEPSFPHFDVTGRRDFEERVFWTFCGIMQNIMSAKAYDGRLVGVHRDQEILWNFVLSRKDPNRRQLWNALLGRSSGSGTTPSLSLVTTEWYMTLFVNVLPTETLLRVWDCLFHEGSIILIKVTSALLEMHEGELLGLRDADAAWRCLKNAPRQLYDAHGFLKAVFQLHRKAVVDADA
jgi:hypothetical protein